jgi:hypothetical protein
MAWPLVAVAAAGLVLNYVSSKKGSKGAKKESKEQARLEGLTTAEQLRILDIEQRAMYGNTLAGYAGGGVQATAPTLGGEARAQTGSPQAILAEQAKEFGLQKDITQKVGATKAAQALTRGKNVADDYRWTGYANVASGISNILASYNTAGP